ncbi:MAG TPA: hypothetical protein VEY06_05685, partial [Flavisolibacter sp.]|nr:hypothetical protein [Flavisolibacter sp.]
MKFALKFDLMNKILLSLIGLVSVAAGCTAKTQSNKLGTTSIINMNEKVDTATFATGCFWCTEA